MTRAPTRPGWYIAIHLDHGGSHACQTGLNGNEILVKYSYSGDGDLSGTVDLDDFTLFLYTLNNQGAPL